VGFSAAKRGAVLLLLDQAEGLGASVGFVFGEAADDASLGEAVGEFEQQMQ
jgi:hypothetical protein